MTRDVESHMRKSMLFAVSQTERAGVVSLCFLGYPFCLGGTFDA